MKVREAYEKAYGPIPEDHWCGVGSIYYDGEQYVPIVYRGSCVKTWLVGEGWSNFSVVLRHRHVDDLPAVMYRGILDELYDLVLPKEESRWKAFTDEELELIRHTLMQLHWVVIDETAPHHRIPIEIQAELNSRKEEAE